METQCLVPLNSPCENTPKNKNTTKSKKQERTKLFFLIWGLGLGALSQMHVAFCLYSTAHTPPPLVGWG
jgi:hypothetical protein